jgi:autotransporter-associated beta strand protein
VISSLNASALTLSGTGALRAAADITLNSNRGITLGSSGGGLQAASGKTLTYGGVIAGSNALTINGASQTGTVTLSGTNTYTGITTISGGILSISNEANLGAVPASTTANQLTLSGGALQVTDNVSLDAKRGITVGSSGSGLAATSGKTLTVPGYITSGSSYTLTINGASQAGTVLLSGDSAGNVYAYALMSVSAGTLAVSHGGALGDSNASYYTTVASGATLDLQGAISVAEKVNLNGGTLKTSIWCGGVRCQQHNRCEWYPINPLWHYLWSKLRHHEDG